MKRILQGSLILILLVGLLVGCGANEADDREEDNNKTTEVEESKDNTKNEREDVDSEEILSTEAMFKIFAELLIQIDMRMDKVYSEHASEWEGGSWMSEFSSVGEKTDEFLEAEKVIQKELAPYFTKTGNEQMAQFYLEHYFCECDSTTINEVKDLRVRFDGEQIDEDTFTVSFIELAAYEGPIGFPGGTNTYTLEKIDDTWKIADYKLLPSDKKPLNITREELAKDLNLVPDQIKEEQIDGETHFRVPFGNETIVINAKDSRVVGEDP